MRAKSESMRDVRLFFGSLNALSYDFLIKRIRDPLLFFASSIVLVWFFNRVKAWSSFVLLSFIPAVHDVLIEWLRDPHLFFGSFVLHDFLTEWTRDLLLFFGSFILLVYEFFTEWMRDPLLFSASFIPLVKDLFIGWVRDLLFLWFIYSFSLSWLLAFFLVVKFQLTFRSASLVDADCVKYCITIILFLLLWLKSSPPSHCRDGNIIGFIFSSCFRPQQREGGGNDLLHRPPPPPPLPLPRPARPTFPPRFPKRR